MTEHGKSHLPMKSQVTYANILQAGAWSGIAILLVTYGIYVLGIFEPHIALATVPEYWSHGVHHFVTDGGAPQGWTWLGMLGTGDYVNFIGLALLALLTIVCYLVLIPSFVRRKDWIFTFICIAEVLVLSVAASGILGSGGH